MCVEVVEGAESDTDRQTGKKSSRRKGPKYHAAEKKPSPVVSPEIDRGFHRVRSVVGWQALLARDIASPKSVLSSGRGIGVGSLNADTCAITPLGDSTPRDEAGRCERVLAGQTVTNVANTSSRSPPARAELWIWRPRTGDESVPS